MATLAPPLPLARFEPAVRRALTEFGRAVQGAAQDGTFDLFQHTATLRLGDEALTVPLALEARTEPLTVLDAPWPDPTEHIIDLLVTDEILGLLELDDVDDLMNALGFADDGDGWIVAQMHVREFWPGVHVPCAGSWFEVLAHAAEGEATEIGEWIDAVRAHPRGFAYLGIEPAPLAPPPVYYITGLEVHPRAQGHGLGLRLLRDGLRLVGRGLNSLAVLRPLAFPNALAPGYDPEHQPERAPATVITPELVPFYRRAGFELEAHHLIEPYGPRFMFGDLANVSAEASPLDR